jgi:hypothetical protein
MDDKQKLGPDCGGHMDVGFVFDRYGGGLLIQRWIKGRPKQGLLHSEPMAGYSMTGRECRLVETYRCDHCGLLKSYATQETDPATLSRP